MNILDKINEHIEVYNNAGKKPPIFRMTCEEHKEFYNIAKEFFKENKIGRLGQVGGCDVELVVIVPPYF